jgi:hypothetical protein
VVIFVEQAFLDFTDVKSVVTVDYIVAEFFGQFMTNLRPVIEFLLRDIVRLDDTVAERTEVVTYG